MTAWSLVPAHLAFLLSCLAWLLELPRMVADGVAARLRGYVQMWNGVEERGDDGAGCPSRLALSAHSFVSGKDRANDGAGCPPGSRCRVAVLHGETDAVESVFGRNEPACT
jgi:hypothetical protein